MGPHMSHKCCECLCSIATGMTSVFQKNEMKLSGRFVTIMKIFDKIDDSKAEGSFRSLSQLGMLFLSY